MRWTPDIEPRNRADRERARQPEAMPAVEPARRGSYGPREGSVAGRALAALKANGEAMSSTALAAAIGAEPGGLLACLESVCRNGLVAKEKRDGLLWWSVGDGKPWEKLKVDVAAVAPKQARAEAAPAPALAVQVAAAPAPAPGIWVSDAAPTAEAFACALFNDGRLLIEIGDDQVALTVEQTRELCRYLDALRSIAP